ncbi:hypothetical protein Q3G72_018982 [Acer saccharum]|nr:hypothetical protein Q3G72_018982 [Acer saccharum]
MTAEAALQRNPDRRCNGYQAALMLLVGEVNGAARRDGVGVPVGDEENAGDISANLVSVGRDGAQPLRDGGCEYELGLCLDGGGGGGGGSGDGGEKFLIEGK